MENERFPYSPIARRPRLRWPDDARVALWVIPNIEHYRLDLPSTSLHPATAHLVPDVLNYSWRDYAPRVGVWRLMDCLDRHGIRGTVALNSDVCRFYPEIIEEGRKRNWEWMGHGITNSKLIANLTEEEERAILAEVTETIAEATGQRPKGWLGPALTETLRTPDLLAELGYTYLCDWVNDDQPYPMRVRQGSLLSIPYSIEVNDIPAFLGQGLSGPEFCQVLKDQFDQLYAEGAENARVMAICLHPFLIGQPFRIRYLDEALAYILGHDRVWATTGGEIAEWYLHVAGDGAA